MTTRRVSRRRVLSAGAAALAAGLAGCSTLGGDAPTHGVTVRNGTDRRRRVFVTVTDDDGRVLLGRKPVVKPGGATSTTFAGRPAELAVTVGGAESRFDWKTGGCGGPLSKSATVTVSAGGDVGVAFECVYL